MYKQTGSTRDNSGRHLPELVKKSDSQTGSSIFGFTDIWLAASIDHHQSTVEVSIYLGGAAGIRHRAVNMTPKC